MSDSRMRELEARHADLLRSMDAPEAPAELRSRDFLLGIYERANAQVEAELDPDVVDELERRIPAPADDVAFDSPSLRSIADTPPAPGMLKTRIRAEFDTWRGEQRVVARRRRVLSMAAAAMVLCTGLWTFVALNEDQPETTSSDRDSIVIVRHRVSQPIAPGFSRNAILREIGEGGRDGR